MNMNPAKEKCKYYSTDPKDSMITDVKEVQADDLIQT